MLRRIRLGGTKKREKHDVPSRLFIHQSQFPLIVLSYSFQTVSHYAKDIYIFCYKGDAERSPVSLTSFINQCVTVAGLSKVLIVSAILNT